MINEEYVKFVKFFVFLSTFNRKLKDILGFIKNKNGFFNVYIHCSSDDWINYIAVWAEN